MSNTEWYAGSPLQSKQAWDPLLQPRGMLSDRDSEPQTPPICHLGCLLVG